MKKLLLLLAILLSTAGASAENYILYTSTDGEVVKPHETYSFGAKIVSNTYENGQGKILFDGEVKKIGEDAFERCASLTAIKIPNSVTEIGNRAFDRCTSLTSVVIPNSVTTIGADAFYGCSSLESFTGKFASEDHRCLIVDGVLTAFAPVELTSYSIPNTVTSIGSGAFSCCSSLTSVVIPKSVTKIGDGAFFACYGLTSMKIPNSVTKIGNFAFEGCFSLTSVVIPNSVTKIGDGAFHDCFSLTSVVIPKSVKTIEYYTFYKCSSLKKITSLNTTPPNAENCCFFDVPTSTCVLKVPSESVKAYKAADEWKEFTNIVGI